MSEIESETMREITPEENGRYTVLSTLKAGRHSRVFLAERAGKRFILKAPASAGARDLELLRREWEMSIGLSHPALSYVFTWEEETPVGPAIVQEWVDGRPLKDYLEEKPSLEERKRVFGQLLEAVSYLHGKGVIHNDLSPANVLISRADNAVKIIDLGFADDDMHITGKALGGTAGFASPELHAGLPVDARSDIYSLGALMKLVFPGRYGRIARRCLNGDPAKRYGSTDALAKAVKNYWWPMKVAAAVIVLALFVGLALWGHKYVSELSAQVNSNAHDSQKIDSLETTIGTMNHLVDSLTTVLDSVEAEKAAQQQALDKSKAKVDTWFSREVSAFRRALKAAKTQEDVTSAWADLAKKYVALHSETIRMTPPGIQPVVINYLYDKYNSVFPNLQTEMTARLNEIDIN